MTILTSLDRGNPFSLAPPPHPAKIAFRTRWSIAAAKTEQKEKEEGSLKITSLPSQYCGTSGSQSIHHARSLVDVALCIVETYFSHYCSVTPTTDTFSLH